MADGHGPLEIVSELIVAKSRWPSLATDVRPAQICSGHLNYQGSGPGRQPCAKNYVVFRLNMSIPRAVVVLFKL